MNTAKQQLKMRFSAMKAKYKRGKNDQAFKDLFLFYMPYSAALHPTYPGLVLTNFQGNVAGTYLKPHHLNVQTWLDYRFNNADFDSSGSTLLMVNPIGNVATFYSLDYLPFADERWGDLQMNNYVFRMHKVFPYLEEVI